MSEACIPSFSVYFSFTHWSSCRVSVQPYIFSLHHTVPQVLKESSTDVSLSPGPGFGGYCIPGLQVLAAQDRLMNPGDWPCVP